MAPLSRPVFRGASSQAGLCLVGSPKKQTNFPVLYPGPEYATIQISHPHTSNLILEEEYDPMAPKYCFVADTLRLEIANGQYSDSQMLPTEQQLCQRFQSSRQTVRRALSVLEEEKLITRRQGSGSRLRESSREEALSDRSIVVMSTYISDYIFPRLLQGMEGVLTAHGSAPLLYATQNQVATERKILQTLLIRKDLDGILVEGSKTALPNPNLDLYHKLLDQGVRLVFLNGSYPELSYIPSVLADDCGGGRLLVEYLHKKGHQHIGGIFKSDDRQGILRYAGFVQALRDLSLPMEDSQLFWYNTESRKSFHSDAFVDAVLESLRGCSALVCYNDEIALRVVTRLRRKGVAVPGEIAVVSFDNSQYSELAPVRITSLSHGEQNLGELAATLLLRTLQEEQCQSQVVPWVLVEKESG